MAEQLVRCVIGDGACAWRQQDPDDSRPCVSLCALDINQRDFHD